MLQRHPHHPEDHREVAVWRHLCRSKKQQETGEARIGIGYAGLAAAVGRRDLAAIRSFFAAEYRELQVDGEERDLDDIMGEWADHLSREPCLRR
jgi:hypothetical protein